MTFSELSQVLRSFARNPAWTAAVVLTLALGVGANTTLFAYVASILWPTIDAPEPHRLVHFAGSASAADDPAELWTSGPDFFDYHAENEVFSVFGASTGSLSLLTRSDGTSLRAYGEEVYGEYFELFGIRPAVGRLLTPTDEPSVIVLGYEFWQKTFQGDPRIVGSTVTLDSSTQVTVVGVAPAGFQGSEGPVSYYFPADKHPEGWRADREEAFLWSMARLRYGVSIAQAQAAMTTLGRILDQRHPRETPRRVDVRQARTIRPFLEETAAWKTQSKALMGAVALFLALACANVANLLLARAVGKRHEVAVRRALGAGRWPLARRVLTECLVLALAGGALGIAIGGVGARLLNGYVAVTSLGFSDIRTDLVFYDERSAFFGAAIALAAAFFFSLAPLADAWRGNALSGLRHRGGPEIKGAGALRRGLVVAQVALSLTLLLAAGLLGRTLLKLRQVDPGFESENLYIASLYMPRLPGVVTDAVYQQIAERVRGFPGVENVGQTLMPPLSGRFTTMSDAELDNGTTVTTYRRTVSPDYHTTLGVDLLAGRGFNVHDTEDAPLVVLVNRAFTESAGVAGGAALGRSFTLPWGAHKGEQATVVGIVANTRLKYLHDAPKPAYFDPIRQRVHMLPWSVMMIRTADGAVHPGPALAKVLRDEFPGVALTDMAPFAEQVRRNVSDQRLSADLALAIAALGLLLAMVGLGSVLSYAVSCRRQEIGLRMALGATVEKVVRMVLGEAGRIVAVGLVLGAAGILVLGRVLESQLYGLVSIGDLPTLAVAPAVLAAAALAAAWVPARRAARIDPAAALREE